MTALETVEHGSEARARWFEAVDWAPWKQAVVYVAVTRLAFFMAAYATTLFFTSTPGATSADGFLNIWERWDARHFLAAAEHGWSGPQALEARTAAFFPLYPLAIRGLVSVGANPIFAALAISTAACVVATAFMIKLAERDVGAGYGRRAGLYLLLFPTAVFLVAPYSEALFLAGAIPAFYFARAGRWMLAAIPMAIATSTRFAGVFLVVGLAVELFRQLWQKRAERPWSIAREGVAALVAATLPVIAFGFHLQGARGSFFQFRTDQLEGWGRDFVSPVQSFLATWNTRVGGYEANWIFAWRIEILAALAGVLLTLWALVKKEWGYATYMGIFIAVLMTSSWYFSIPRMLLTFFPAVIFLTEFAKDERRHELILLVFAPLATMGVIVFTRGAWFL
ncbi:MAG TPA: mannosyltransferase family protein [Actinomycetota bacterium]|nr:mannosyltransferase family protein [Actinomycetota bacterium]